VTFPIEALQQHIAIVGKTGSGKTYTAKGLVEGLLEAKRRVCILDPTGAWYGLRSSADGKRAGFPVAVFGGMHGDVPIAEQSGATLAHILANKNLPAIIDLSEMLIGQRHRFVTDFAEAIYRENKTPLHLIIDEADEFIPQNPLPETKRLLHHIDRIIRRGRIRGFRVMMITQRPAVIHKNALTQANTLVVMRLTAPQDRKAIQAWIDGNGDANTGKMVLDSLARLQRGEGWVWAPELGTLERETFPLIATFDSSRSPGDDETVPEPTKLADVDLGEISASFEAVEQEARTLDGVKKENAQLKHQLGIAHRSIERAQAEALKHSAKPDLNLHKTTVDIGTRKVLERIAELAQKELARTNPQGSHDGREADANPKAARLPRTATTRPAPVASGAGVSIPSGERTVLTAIAQHPNGVTREQLTVLTGYKRSTRDSYLQRMREKHMVNTDGATIIVTAIGLSALGDDFEPLPTGDALQKHWLAKLPEGESRILGQLCAAYPDSVSRDEIGHVHGYARSSRDAYLQRLKARQLIAVVDRGSVRAAAHLF
jgi:hypothetical protein